MIGGDLSVRVVGVVVCPDAGPWGVSAWVAAVVITGGLLPVVVRYRADGGAPAVSVRVAGVLSSLSVTVVDIVGAGTGWGRVGSTGARPKSPPTAAERLTCGWFPDIRVAARAPGGCAAPAVGGASGRGERFAAAAVTYPVGAGVAILVELTALGRRVVT